MSKDGQEQELKELLDKISNLELPTIDIKELCTPCPSFEIEDLLEILKDSSKYLIVDVRSEAEYEATHIPGAVNMPIANNKQRHTIGLIFKQESEQLAAQVGAYYAYQKVDSYVDEIKEAANERTIIVHCWRGGFRSKAVTALLIKNGLNAVRLNGGIKSFRRTVHHYLYEHKYELIALSGKTGTGKSEVLEEMQKHGDIPVLHIEEAASHASSVFGPVRFGCDPVESQQDFETRLFFQMLPWLKDKEMPLFVTEKESPKIGRLIVPPSIQIALKEEKHIHLDCPLDLRVKRLYREYIESIGEDKKDYLRERITYLQKTVSKQALEEFLQLYDTEQWDILLEKILVEYYDLVYKKTETKPLGIINNTSISETILKIKELITTKGNDKP